MSIDFAIVFGLKFTVITFHKTLRAMSTHIDFIFERQLAYVTLAKGYFMHLDVLAVMVSIPEFIPTQYTNIGDKGGVHTAAAAGTGHLTVH